MELKNILYNRDFDYPQLVNNTSAVIGELDIKGNFTFITPSVYNMLGYLPEEVIGRNLLDFIHNRNIKMLTKIFGKNTKAKEQILKIRIKSKNKSYLWSQITVKRVKNDRSQNKILITLNDISKLKVLENNLQKSKNKYRNMIETSAMGLLEINLLTKKVEYINPKILEIVGYENDPLIYESLFQKIIFPEGYKGLLKLKEEKDLVFRIIAKDGKTKWLSGKQFHIYNKKGDLWKLRLWLQDITERKELEEIKSSLLIRFSHEFKTPLIAIKGFTDLLLTEYRKNLDDTIIPFLEEIKDGGNRLIHLIHSFLESSQFAKEMIKLDLAEGNLSSLIKASLSELDGLIKIRGHTIHLNIQDEINISMDKDRIYSVITNILLNAIKYTPFGGKLLIQSTVMEDSVIISVKDNGIGLEEEEISRLFTPFGKVEKFGKGWDIITEGMGMGLYLSKEIIDLHKGKIWAESEGINEGSIFSFSLPIAKNIDIIGKNNEC